MYFIHPSNEYQTASTSSDKVRCYIRFFYLYGTAISRTFCVFQTKTSYIFVKLQLIEALHDKMDYLHVWTIGSYHGYMGTCSSNLYKLVTCIGVPVRQ